MIILLIVTYHPAFKTILRGGLFREVQMFLISQTLQKLSLLYQTEKVIFDNCLEFQIWLHKEVLLVLPHFSLVLFLFHQAWAEDWQVLHSLIPSNKVLSFNSSGLIDAHVR